MSLQDQPVVAAFREAWEEQFPDVPWVEREIFVPVAGHAPAREFTFVFTGIDDFPQIDLVWREDGPGLNAAMDVRIEPTDGVKGMRLTLEGFDSAWLHGFRLVQQGDCRFAALGCVQHDENGSTTLYSSKARCEEFKTFLVGWYERCGPERQPEIAPLLLMASQLACGLVREATRVIDRSAHAQELVAAHPWLPAKFGLEYITHGLKRTFRFWGEQARADSLREAVEVVRALGPVSANACIFGGAALGMEREGRLLPHDDDLDILIVVDGERYPDLGTALESIALVLERAGWQVVGHFFSHLWVKTRSGVAPTLDIFVGIAEGERVSYYPLPRRALEKARMFPPVWRRLEGVEIPVPRDLPYYLESEYGPQWRVPDAGFRLTWDRRPYADLAGNRAHPVLCTRGEQAFVARSLPAADEADGQTIDRAATQRRVEDGDENENDDSGETLTSTENRAVCDTSCSFCIA